VIDFIIREAVPGDAEGVVKIMNPIIEAGVFTVLENPITVEGERSYIENFPQRGVILVAQLTGNREIVGIRVLEPYAPGFSALDHVAVVGTFVKLPYRRMGIGSGLWRSIVNPGIEKGFEKVFTYVRADNQSSINFYLKLGFRISVPPNVR
jgi:L-amino acid N-acyltransferase YncA